MDRGERRFRTQRISWKRYQPHLASILRWYQLGRDISWAASILPPVGVYRKRTSFGGHSCTKHRHGSPHYGWGACYMGSGVRPTVKVRHDARKIIEEELILG